MWRSSRGWLPLRASPLPACDGTLLRHVAGMREVRVVVTSDWHLDKSTAGVDRFDDIAEAVTDIVDYAIKTNRDDSRTAFVFAGDLTNPDTDKVWRAVQFACRQAELLAAGCVPSVWIPGNHDVCEDGKNSHTLMPIDNGNPLIHVVAKPGPVVLWNRVVLLCLPYVPRSHAYTPSAWIRCCDPDMVVSHLMLEGIAPGSETKDMPRGRDVFLPVDELREVWPDAYLVNGHYHEAQLYRGVHVPGAVARLTRGEAGNSPRFLEFTLKVRNA